MNRKPSLNPQQLAAVKHTDTPLLVLAGAGSGKTRVITEKIVYLIRKKNIKAQHIAAITFTNKAAREMLARVSTMIDSETRKGLTLSTFHSLGLKIIQQELKTLGYQPGFSILDSQDSTSIIRELSKQDNIELDESIRWQISAWKNELVSPKAAAELADNDSTQLAARFYSSYQRQLKAYNGVDFDDLIVLPMQLFVDFPEIRDKWQNKLRYLLVDEYQDTNTVQYQLVKSLAGPQGRLTAVGDDDQSIYAWRGAKPENISQLEQDFPTLKTIKLEQNYRSSGNILKSANHIIANNPRIIDKNLWSAHGAGDLIRVTPCDDSEHEATRVAGEIMSKTIRNKAKHENFAILYRSNHQSRPFEKALREHRIPYKVSGGTSFFERTEIKDLMAYLRLIANADDNVAFLRIINTPRRSIGASTLENLAAYSRQRNTSLFKACSEIGLQSKLGRSALLRLQRFSDWVRERNNQSISASPVDMTNIIISDTGLDDWVRETSKSPEMAARKLENMDELVSWISNIHKNKPDADLEDIVRHMSLMDMLENNEDDDAPGAVQLMTLHAAKGLEFPYVYMTGMEEGLLPHKNCTQEIAIEEERRLAYVGITRAMRQLTLTYANKRVIYGDAEACEPSRFLQELPMELLEWEDKNALSIDKEVGRAYLNNLKAMLDFD